MTRRFSIVAVAMLANLTLAGAIAYAQDKPAASPPVAFQDPVTITMSRAMLQKAAQGVMKLPYEDASPILNEWQGQLNKLDQAATEDAKKLEAEKAAKEPAKDQEKVKTAPPKDAK